MRPNKAYFGQKDYQQFSLIQKMVQELDFGVELKMMPIAREPDGLALSSRNQYLDTPDKRDKALTLFKTLSLVGEMLSQGHLSEAKKTIEDRLKTDPNWDYIEIRQRDLSPLEEALPSKIVLLGAYNVEGTRLIDNFIINIHL